LSCLGDAGGESPEDVRQGGGAVPSQGHCGQEGRWVDGKRWHASVGQSRRVSAGRGEAERRVVTLELAWLVPTLPVLPLCPGRAPSPSPPSPPAHPSPAVPSGLCDALRTGSGSAASCQPRCPQHKALLRRRIALGFEGESRTKNRSLSCSVWLVQRHPVQCIKRSLPRLSSFGFLSIRYNICL